MKSFDPEQLGKNPPEKYIWGLFYYNPADPRVIVPKNIRWAGWTLNFANPFSYAIILGFILAAVLLDYFF
jgi:uncharacterized membrane protein